MTREEIIKGLNDIAPKKPKSEWGRCQREIVDEAINALQTEPCEDAISRETVASEFADWFGYNYQNQIFYKRIKSMPSVQPKPKTGRWEFVQRGKFIDICCSECGYVRVKEYAYNYTIDKLDEREKRKFLAESHMNFCECCGAKMIKSQESEDAE